jgi:CRISPR/Cas system-associated exonuclease Cas4 (RecB family)
VVVNSNKPVAEKSEFKPGFFDADSLKKNLKDKLISEHIARQQYEKPHCAVTEILGCVRQQFYYRRKYTIDVDRKFNFPYLEMYSSVGTALHEVIQKYYGFDEIKKPLFSENYKVKGEADAIKFPSLFEIKSTDTRNFKGTYEKAHYDQGNIYAYILNKEYGYNLEYVTILYIFRDDLRKDPKGFDVKIDENQARTLLNKSLVLLESIDTGIVPEALGASEKECRYCPYVHYCRSDNNVILSENDYGGKIEVQEEKKQTKKKDIYKVYKSKNAFEI